MISEREMDGKDPQALRARLLTILGGCRDDLAAADVVALQQLADDIAPPPPADPFLIAARELQAADSVPGNRENILAGRCDHWGSITIRREALKRGAELERKQIVHWFNTRRGAYSLDEVERGEHWEGK